MPPPSVVSADKKSSHWSSYDLELKDFDEFSDGASVRGPCEIESDDEYDRQCIERRHHMHRQDHRTLLTENSKWTVTVRLYAQKAREQRGSDIPSVEDTGSNYSPGEVHGKSGSSPRSRGSAKRPIPSQPNGVVPREYVRYRNRGRHNPNPLHYSYSERPLTKKEREEYTHAHNSATNPSYAWPNGRKAVKDNPSYSSFGTMGNGIVPVNGLSLGGTHHQKYEHTGNLSTYLSIGTNTYKQARDSARGANRRREGKSEESWQGLCDTRAAPLARPHTSHPTRGGGQNVHREFDPVCDHDSLLSESAADSLPTDYLGDGDILEDLSASRHSLSTSGKRASISTSGQGTSVYQTSPDSDIVIDSLLATTPSVLDKTYRPKAALRRHRSEPFHFLV